MKSITLNNGHVYKSWYGGQFQPERKPLENKARGIIITGNCCTLRKYHTLRKVTEGGRDWIIERHKSSQGWHHKVFAHFDIKSTDGKFHIARYFDEGGFGRDFIYYIYESYTWRKNMESTFGNHVRGIGGKGFSTAKEAMEAVKGM